jgi:SnoaL-like domain
MEVTELVDRYCQVWNEPDPSIRDELLASLWASDATYTDPSVHAVGASALLAHIAAVRARRPGAAVLRTSAVDVHHGVARFAWHVVHADGTALPEGIDIVFLSSDGSRIERIIGFFGPIARAPQ